MDNFIGNANHKRDTGVSFFFVGNCKMGPSFAFLGYLLEESVIFDVVNFR